MNVLSSFQLFAVGLVSGALLQALGLGLGWWCRHRPDGEAALLNSGAESPAGAGKRFLSHLGPRTALGCWLCGVFLLLTVAVHDHDPTLFTGQVLATFAFWKMGWCRA